MGEAFLDYKKGAGLKLNDIIEEFKYVYKGQNIKAGDFVNFINGVAGQTTETSVDTVIDNVNTYAGYKISAVVLNSNKIFVSHSYGSNYYLYGVVLTINGATITLGSDTQLSSTAYSGNAMETIVLDENRVFIARRNGSSSGGSLYGMICTINGTTITVNTDTAINSSNYTGTTISAVALDKSRIFIAHRYNSSNALYGIVCTINGTTISKGSETSISTATYASDTISAALLNDGKVFIAHNYGANYYLYGIVCSISGTTITKGTATSLNNSTEHAGASISTRVLPNGNVLIAHTYTSSYYLYGLVCSVSGTTITKGTDTQLSSESYTGIEARMVVLNDNDVLIAHTYTSSYYLYGIVCSISGTTITKGTDTQLNSTTHTGFSISALPLGESIIIIHSHTTSKYYLYAQMWGINGKTPTNKVTTTQYEQQVATALEAPFDGVALTNGTGGTATAHKEQIKIAVPDVEVI